MQTRFSEELEKIVEYARDEAMRTGYYAICTEHLLLGMLRHSGNKACNLLVSLGEDLDQLKRRIDAQILKSRSIPYEEMDDIYLSRESQNTLSLSVLEASMRGVTEAGSAELLLALTRSEGDPCREMLATSGIDRAAILALLGKENEIRAASVPPAEDIQKALLFGLDQASNFIDNDTKILS